MADTIEQIDAKIAKAKKQLENPALSKFHEGFKTMITKLEEDKKALEGAKKDGEKPAIKKDEKKVVADEKKLAKEEKKMEKTVNATKKAPAKKAAKKAVAKSAKKVAEKKPTPTKEKNKLDRDNKRALVNGKWYDVEDCEIAIAMWDGIRAQRSAATKKFIKKKEGTVIGDKISSAVSGVMKNISAAALKKPSMVKAKMLEMQKTLTKLASLMDDILGGGSVSKEVKDAVKVIERFVKDKLNKK